MIPDPVDELSRAVLHEGYLLYPYRADALKNRFRWTFGTLLPPALAGEQAGAESERISTQCLVEGAGGAELSVELRFLQLEGGAPRQRTCAAPSSPLRASDAAYPLAFPPLRGSLSLSCEPLATDLWRVTAGARNATPCDEPTREGALARSFLSAHMLLRVRGAAFVSCTDPPAHLREAAAACRQERVWPVLAGTPGDRDAVLAAPIILPDYPRLAPESPLDLFDGTEIDELLVLRIQSLAPAEKEALRAGDPRAAAMLAQVESLPRSTRMRLHGAWRDGTRGAADFAPGDRVRLRPRPGSDALDVVLADRHAIVVAVEQDVEGGVQLAVVLEDDPGRDLGAAGYPAHRFYYRSDEVERAGRR